MKKLLFVFILAVMQVSCSEPTNEKKASRLIESDLKSQLYNPDTYKMIEIQLDSCFTDEMGSNANVLDLGIKIAKLYKEYKEIKYEAEEAESSMTIYAPRYSGYQSAHSQQQYEKHKKELELARRKLESRKDQIISLYKNNMELIQNIVNKEHDFTGMVATLYYSAENMFGHDVKEHVIYFFDKDITKILDSFDENDLDELNGFDAEEFKFEFEEELTNELINELGK